MKVFKISELKSENVGSAFLLLLTSLLAVNKQIFPPHNMHAIVFCPDLARGATCVQDA